MGDVYRLVGPLPTARLPQKIAMGHFEELLDLNKAIKMHKKQVINLWNSTDVGLGVT